MSIKSKRLLAMAVASALSTAGSAYATNGYFSIGYGAGSEGIGGVGVTTPQDTLCVGGNPACLSAFDRPQFDVGVGLFDARRRSGIDDATLGRGNAWSDSNTFLIPGMGFVWPFNDQLTIGVAVLGNGGMDTSYKPNFFANISPPNTEYLGVNMVQLFVPITATWKFNEKQAVGVSMVPARQRFWAQGLQKFDSSVWSSAPGYVTNNGHDMANGFGVRLGWLGHFVDDKVSLGVTWASKVYMEQFEHYKGLFAGSGGFDVPENYAVGIAVKPVENWTVALDVQKILYSDVPSVGNRGPFPNGGLPVGENKMGLEHGIGFGWNDMTVYKLGVVHKHSENLTLRAGYNYGKNPIPADQLTMSVIAPGVSEEHYTLGLTYNLGDQSILGFGSEGALTVSYVHSPTKRLAGPSMDGTVDYEMTQNMLGLAYTLKF